MARIFLMRHAKAVPLAANASDFDRPLEESGRRDAARVGAVLRERWALPEAVVCSGSRRTRETLAALGFTVENTRFSDAIFDGDASDYIDAVRAGTTDSLLLIAHNPSIHNAALLLTGSGEDESCRRLSASYPTATVAILDHPGPLASVGTGTCRLEALLSPKTLPGA